MNVIKILTDNGINVEASLDLFGDMETYNETLNDFLAGVDKKIDGIKNSKAGQDMANYAILVHSLKSDSKYLGFTKLAELSYEHEMKSKENDVNYVNANYDELINEIYRVLNVVKQYANGDAKMQNQEATRPVVNGKTILVVDDSDIIRNFIKKIFNNTYDVMIARDGKEAIDIVSVEEQGKIIGLFLDLNMPNVNGFEVLEHFKENNLFNKIPVSVITGDDSKEAVQKAFQYPIVDMLNKPFNEKDVKIIVEKTINYGK